MKLFLVGITLFGLINGQLTNEIESDNIAYHCFEIYKKIYNSRENLVYSPLSFHVLYSILYQTSFGKTETELRNQLFANNTHEADKSSIQSIQSMTLARILSSDTIKLANKVYLATGKLLNKELNSLVELYKSEVEQVDFRKTAEVTNKMNQWVEEKTKHLITNLISEDSVTSDTQLFLINTLYFKSQWRSPFTLQEVRNSTFHNIDGSESEIEFIQDEDYYRVANINELKVDVLELPYRHDSNFVFWIIVPHDDSNLNNLNTQLSAKFLRKIKSSITNSFGTIKFPIFTIETEVDGKQIANVLFERAELNMLQNSNPLKVDEIKQKTKIIVNTNGTEAASATYFKMMLMSDFVSVGETTNVIADRPFVFAILTEDCTEPIFVGHYVNAAK